MSVKVNIKWGKELFKDVEVNLSGTAADFRQQLFSLTNVEPGNQKVMGKGMTLKDADWESFKKVLVPGAALMMMGTPSQIIQAVTEVTTATFVEDMPEDAQLMLAENLAPGLTNLGNTCYMNASVQMMNAMPELQAPLDLYKPTAAQSGEPQAKLTVAMRDLVHQLRTQKSAIMPFMFLTMLRQSFPQFAEQVGGKYLQQCADECWTQMVHAFKRLPQVKVESAMDVDGAASSSSSSGVSGIEQLLQGEMIRTTKCIGSDDEAPTTEKELFEVLHCHIDSKIAFLYQGVNQGLNSTLEKRSPLTNQNAQYSISTRINRLPYYLVVQLLRFEWRPGAKHRSKILREVAFPFDLDANDFCTDDLKAKLSVKREQIRVRKDLPAEQRTPIEQTPFENETGYYELAAVLTHMGRDADGGHYVAWVRQEGDKWLLFDDDKVSGATPEDIKKLYGGADWHMAFLCLYRTKQFK